MLKLLLRTMPLALASLSLAMASPSLAQPVAAPRDGSHDMDFSLGSWRTDVTIIKDPFAASSPETHMTGTKVARPLWNGKAVIEEIEADGPQGHWEALNVFLYDPAARQWSENYADSSDGQIDPVPGIGGWRNGTVEFYRQQRIGGEAMLVRGIWKDITRDAHTYEISRSRDGGRTWHVSFIVHVTRQR